MMDYFLTCILCLGLFGITAGFLMLDDAMTPANEWAARRFIAYAALVSVLSAVNLILELR